MDDAATPDDFSDLDFSFFNVEGGAPKTRAPWNGEEAFNRLAAEVQAKRDAKTVEAVARTLDISPLLQCEEYKDGHAHLYVAAKLGNGKRGWFRLTKRPVHSMNMTRLVKEEWAKCPGIALAVSPKMPKVVA